MWVALFHWVLKIYLPTWHDWENYIGFVIIQLRQSEYYIDVIMSMVVLHWLLNRLFRHRSKKTSYRCTNGLCDGNPPMTYGFPSQKTVTREMLPLDGVIMKPVHIWITVLPMMLINPFTTVCWYIQNTGLLECYDKRLIPFLLMCLLCSRYETDSLIIFTQKYSDWKWY